MPRSDKYKERQYVVMGIIIVVLLIYVIRLFVLQIIDNSYKSSANNNALYEQTIYPSRGLIYDRNGELLVYNQPSYEITIIMKEFGGSDTLALCDVLGISREWFDERVKYLKDRRQNPGYSQNTPQVLLSQLSVEDYASIQDRLFQFKGIYVQNRSVREYTYQNAANILGYINEVGKKTIENDSYYKAGDFIGISGIEKQYEKYLRGEKGKKILLRNAKGMLIGSYKNGELDEPATSGKDLTLSIDMNLQRYGELLMQNKLGSIVCIEPSTGEILAAVSSPCYTPNMMVGKSRSVNYKKLSADPYKPLLNRPFQGAYPPGSTFKTVNALICQQEGIITPQTKYGCHFGYTVGSFHLGCHGHASPLDLSESIQHSCNAYYCAALRALLDNPKYGDIRNAFEVWKNHVVSFGYGYQLGVDIPSEARGFIPNSGVYDRIHGKGRWKSLNVVSISIGQGEVTATPVQIANLASTIANRGYWITPHLVKKVSDVDSATYFEKHIVSVEQKHFAPVIQGMDWAVNASSGGTAGGARMDSIIVCGKTGTAQNPHGQDHSIFMAFAPKDNPKIAISIIVENGGFGATYAVPIARLMLEKYLLGEIPEKHKWIEQNMIQTSILPHR